MPDMQHADLVLSSPNAAVLHLWCSSLGSFVLYDVELLRGCLCLQDRVVAARDGMMETLSARHDIFNPAPSAGGAGSGTPGACPVLPRALYGLSLSVVPG